MFNCLHFFIFNSWDAIFLYFTVRILSQSKWIERTIQNDTFPHFFFSTAGTIKTMSLIAFTGDSLSFNIFTPYLLLNLFMSFKLARQSFNVGESFLQLRAIGQIQNQFYLPYYFYPFV